MFWRKPMADEKIIYKCIVPDCTSPAKTRGLCDKCYAAASKDVKAGITTWAELESANPPLAIPSKRGPSVPAPFKAAFAARNQG
jgi:hypothetical protein